MAIAEARSGQYVLMYQQFEESFAMVTTLSSREFQQNANQAQKAARNGPVFITKRGRPVHVLLSFEDYRRITGARRNIVEALSMPGLSDIEIDIPRSRDLPRPADLS
jgi:prevent-host-death family protein